MKRLLLIFAALYPCLVAMAQEVAQHMYMDDLVVTATRTPKMLKDVPVQTRLIGREEIEKSDATNLQDLLEMELPSVEFAYAMNQQMNMNLAGFAGQGVLVLVDGERMAGETNDNVDFSRLSLVNVERVEIVRGSASALYGSSAAGGVINIITRRAPSGKDDESVAWNVHLDARLGTHMQQRYNAVAGLKYRRVGNTFTFSRTANDAYKLQSRGTEAQGMLLSDVFAQNTMNFKDQISWDVSSRLRLSGRLGYFRRTLERQTEVPERYRDYQAGARAEWRITDRDNLDASYSFDQYDKSDYMALRGLDVRRYSNVQNISKAVYTHRFRREDMLTVGADYMYDYLASRNVGEESFVQQSADVFAQYDWNINNRWELVGALRFDHIWGYDKTSASIAHTSRVTPRVAVRWSPANHCRLRASYGMGFRAPSLKEKYYDLDIGLWTIEGNPALKAEDSHNVTLSTEYFYGGYSLTVSGMYNRVYNRITSGLPYEKVKGSQDYYLPYINVDAMNVYGVEIGLQGRWKGGWSARATYAFSHEDAVGQSITPYMPTRPHTLTVRGDWEHRFSRNFRLDVGLTGRVLSGVENAELISLGAPDGGTHTVSYPAYTLWKLQTVGHICSWVKATFTIDNLFNYRPQYYYLNAPLTTGISFLGGVSLDIEKMFGCP